MKIRFLLMAFISCIMAANANAVDLMQVFHEAAACDPTFKAAEAQYFADRENYPIARSYLMPNISVAGSVFRQRISNNTGFSPLGSIDPFYNTETIYSITLIQPIFNYAYWANFTGASYSVKQSEATFLAAEQSLMLRVAQAYFAVLEADDNLRYTLAEKRAVLSQLDQSREQYEVGLIAITAYEEAKAKYDSILASEIAARTDLANALEQLGTLTAKRYATLMGLRTEVPLVRPHPDDIGQWINAAVAQNYDLRAAEYGTDAARENIKEQFAGHLPVVNFQTDYTATHESNPLTFTSGGFSQSNVAEAGVTVALPIFQGGLVNAQTRQAGFLYQRAISDMELTYRNLLANTRDSYLGVVTGISKIKADRQTVISNQISFQATKNAYDAGTRTMLDVLNTQSVLYQSQKTYVSDQYDYLISTLTLKQAAGTLCPQDLWKINNWLTRRVDIAGKIQGIYQPPVVREVVTKQQSKPKSKPVSKTLSKPVPKAVQKTKSKKSVKSSVKTELPKPSKVSLSKQWLAAHQDNYTLELFDTKVAQHAQNFIKKYHLQNKATYYRTKTAEGIRYRVIYGNYATAKEAEFAIQKLPADLGKLHPWVRKFGKITAEMK